MPQVTKILSSNNYCVPAALSALTGLPLDEIEPLIKTELGDQAIRGIFYPLALKILNQLGYQYQEVSPSHAKNFPGLYLVHFHGHMGVIEDKTYYDSQFPQGVPRVSGGKHPRQRIEKVFKVWKKNL